MEEVDEGRNDRLIFDLETAAECLYEVQISGVFQLEALEILAIEVRRCSDIDLGYAEELVAATVAVADAKSSGRTGCETEYLFSLLRRQPGFDDQWLMLFTDHLFGKR